MSAIAPLLQPQTAGRGGSLPRVSKSSFGIEAIYLAGRSKQLYERGTAWSDIGLVY